VTAPLPRPKPTERVGDAAAAVRDLAVATDARLSVLAVVIIADTKGTTSGNGDIAVSFPTLATVAGVVVCNVYGTTGTSLQQLQVPVWTKTPGAPAGVAWLRAVNTLTGAVLANHPVRFNAIGWGVPK
jgi:cobalamin biosynthesis protein CobD/CbiB